MNHGVEGPTEQRVVLAQRRRHRLNLLGTLLLSQGVPMLLAGDELGHGQGGNNNAYAQDNETAWLGWRGLDQDPEFLEEVRQLVALRRRLSLLRQPDYVHGHYASGEGDRDIDWYGPDGAPMDQGDWADGQPVLKLLSRRDAAAAERVAVVVNGLDREVPFKLPGAPSWRLAWSSDLGVPGPVGETYRMAAWSIACLECASEGGPELS